MSCQRYCRNIAMVGYSINTDFEYKVKQLNIIIIMNTRHVLLTVVIASFFLLSACSDENDNVQESEMTSQGELLTKSASASSRSASINNEYPQAQQEVIETFQAITQSIILIRTSISSSLFMPMVPSLLNSKMEYYEMAGLTMKLMNVVFLARSMR